MALRLLWARLAHAPARRLVAVLALALAAAVPVLVTAVSSVTAGAALATALSALPPGERSVTVSYNGIADPVTAARYDAAVTRNLPRIAAGALRRQVIFRQTTDGHGGAVVLAGTDDLRGGVQLLSGRLPASCLPQRCEVVHLLDPRPAAAVGAPGAAVSAPSGLGLVVVGEARRTDPLLLTATFAPEPGVPVLLADGVRAVSALAALSNFGRSLGWVAPLSAEQVRSMGVSAWVAEGASVARDLSDTGEMLVVTAPEDAVRDADSRARASAGRFALLGGSAAILLLGSAVVAGTALRRDRELFDGAVRRRGAGPVLRGWLAAGEVGATAAVGALVGVVGSVPVVAVLAGRVGVPVGPTLTDSLIGSAPAVVLTAAAGSLVLALTLMLAPGGVGARAAWRIADLLLAFCLVAAALVLARGATSVTAVTAGDPLLLVLPALVLAAVALATARLWPPLVGLVERALAELAPGRATALRLGLTAAGGRPLRPVATAGLLAAAVAITGFATAYRTTLDRGAADAAAYASPLDVRLTPGTSLVRPQDAVTPADLAATVGPGGVVAPVVRGVASVAVTAGVGEPVQLVGLDPQVLPLVSRWPAVTGSSWSSRAAAEAITVPAPAPGVPLPAGRRLRIQTPGTPVTLVADAQLRSNDGRERTVTLVVDPGTAVGPAGSAAADAKAGLDGEIPQLMDVAGRPVSWHLVGIGLRQAADAADRRQHNLGEGHVGRAGPGVGIAWGRVSVDGVTVADCWTGWAAIGVPAGSLTIRSGERADLAATLLDGTVTLSARPSGPGSDQELPVLTDPATAQAGPSLTLTWDARPVRLRVVGVLERFPTTRGRFVVADRQALARLADLGTSGTGQGLEVWLAAGPGRAAQLAAAVHGGGFTGLTVARQRAVLAGLRADPVARGAQGLLLAGSVLVLAVALLSLVLLVLADRRDEAASMSAWEADGVRPATLRAALWWRAVAVVAPAVPIGVLAGLGLSRLTAAVAAVTGTGTVAVPPLATGVGVRWGLAVTLVVLAAGLLVAGVVAARAWREPLPPRQNDFGGLR